jgi:hypothetical protein
LAAPKSAKCRRANSSRKLIEIELIAMAKLTRKLATAQKGARKKRQREFMTIFVNGKQRRVARRPQIDGMDVDDFIDQNADPIWLHQNGMWERMGSSAGC